MSNDPGTTAYPHRADLATRHEQGITLLVQGDNGQAVVLYRDTRTGDPLRPVGLRRYQPTGQIADIDLTGQFAHDCAAASGWLDEHSAATALSLIAELEANAQAALLRG